MSGEIALTSGADPRRLPNGAVTPDRDSPAARKIDCWTLVLLIAVGTLLVAVAYYLGRHDVKGATAPYWAGQALILLPTALTNISRSADTRARLGSLVATAAAQAFLAWAYSPDQFRFGDELQHVVTAQNILATHHLYTPNLTLPVSSAFPGLEITTVALMHLTGLSLFHAGVLVASVCHVVVPIAVFLLFAELTGSTRLGALAALVYTLAPHYAYFDTLFVYGAPGIAFATTALWAAARCWRRGSNPVWIVVAFAPLAVTHHASAIAAVAVLAAFSVAVVLSGNRRRGLLFLLITLLIVDDVVGWIEVHAPATFDYLWRPIASSFSHSGAVSHAPAVVATAPIWEHYAAELSALLLVLLILAGIWRVWRPVRAGILPVFSLLGVVYLGVLAVRLKSTDGTELAGRALSYAMILVAVPVAISLSWLWTRSKSRRGRAVAIGTLMLLLVGQIVTGLPAARQRIAGRSYIDARATALGNWAAGAWRTHQIAVCDQRACQEMVSVYAQAFTPAYGAVYRMQSGEINGYLGALKIGYVQAESSGSATAKFDSDPELDRVYDDGQVRVYDAERTWKPS